VDADRAFVWFVYVSLAAAVVLMAVTLLSGDGPTGPDDVGPDGPPENDTQTDGGDDEPAGPIQNETNETVDGTVDENVTGDDGGPVENVSGNDTTVQDESDTSATVPVEPNASDSDEENGTRAMADLERVEQAMIDEINERRTDQYKSPIDSIYLDELWSIAEYHTTQMVERDFFASETPEGETYSNRYHRFDPNCARIDNYRQAYEGIARVRYDPWTNSSAHIADEDAIVDGLVGNLTAPYGSLTDKRYDDVGVDVQYDGSTGYIVTTVAIC
jgi:uncharacterized protein YkwD